MDSGYFDRKHDDATANAALYAFLRDAWDGTGGFAPPLDEYFDESVYGDAMQGEALPTHKAVSYIDRFPRESVNKYRSRVRRAHYTNVVRAVGETLLGFLLRRLPTRTTDDDLLLSFLDEADGEGHTWDELLTGKIAPRTWLFGALPILVDRPSDYADSVATAGRTYATILYPDQLWDWETDSAGEFLWAKVVQSLSECASSDSDRTYYQLATEWTRDGWRRWRKDENDNIAEDGSGTNPCGRVPIVLASMSRPISETILGTSPAHEIGQEARKLYNYQSLLDEHVYGQVYAVLSVVMPGWSKAEGFKLGTDNALIMPEGGSASYLAPPASVADTLFKAVDSCIRRIYRAGRLEFMLKDTGQAESGIARQYEFAGTNRGIASFASEMARVERDVKRLVLLWDGKSEEQAAESLASDSVAWPDDYDVRDLERELKMALDALMLPIGETARKALIRTVRDDMITLTAEEREQSDREIDEGEQVAKGPEADLGSNPPADGTMADEVAGEDSETLGPDGERIASVHTAPDASTVAQDVGVLLAASDKAAVVTVNEVRARLNLGDLLAPGGKRDPDGDLTVEDFRAKRDALRSAQEAETVSSGSAGTLTQLKGKRKPPVDEA